jgi:hypothetical protein
LGNVSRAGTFFYVALLSEGDFEKILPIGGKTSGFTTATTAKGMKALSGKGLACGGYPPQGTAVFTAPPQKKRTPESVLHDFPSHHGGDSERFRLTVDLFSDYIWSCKGGWI